MVDILDRLKTLAKGKELFVDNVNARKNRAMKYIWYLSWQAWLSLLALGVALWTAISYASLIMEIVWILFGAFLLSLAIRPLADRLARRRVPRLLTVLGVYVSLIGLLVVLGALLVPIVTNETTLLQSNGPNLLQTALSRLTSTPLLSRLIPSSDALSQNLISDLYTLAPTFLNTVAGVGETLLNILVVLILAFFLASDTSIGPRLVQSLVPRRYRPQFLLVAGRLRDRLGRWIWAQLAVAFYFALTFGIGLAVLGVPFALTIALISGVLEIMPYVGGTIAVILGILSALTVNPWLAVWVILFWVVVVEVKGHIIEPAFYGRANHIHPAAVLVALLIGVKVKGIMGVFFAIPVAVVLLTLLEEIQSLSDYQFKRPGHETTEIAPDSPLKSPGPDSQDRQEKLLTGFEP
jgi:predicted PurR-regulated permease PerM